MWNTKNYAKCEKLKIFEKLLTQQIQMCKISEIYGTFLKILKIPKDNFLANKKILKEIQISNSLNLCN